jgi:hypothetical protein
MHRARRTNTPRIWIAADPPPSEPVGPQDEKLVPAPRLQAILNEGERGAAAIAELSIDLAERTADVIRCRAELIVARRLAELAKLRREVAAGPDRVEARLELFRSRVHEVVGEPRLVVPETVKEPAVVTSSGGSPAGVPASSNGADSSNDAGVRAGSKTSNGSNDSNGSGRPGLPRSTNGRSRIARARAKLRR